MPTNPRSFQTMYLRLGLGADTYIKKPAGFFGAWNQNAGGAAGTYARYMGPLSGGAGQVSAGQTSWAAIPDGTAQYLAIGQFLSDPLEEQAVPAGIWKVAFALRLANAGAAFTWRGRCALYVIDGRTAQRRSTVFTVYAIASGFLASPNELTVLYDATPGLAFRTLPGDVLELEIGMEVENTTGGPLAPLASMFSDGNVEIDLPFVVTASPQSLLQAPVPLVRVLPDPHEQIDVSVTEEQARQLCLDAWPPNSHHEFGEPGPGQTVSPDSELMDWFGTFYKRFGWDLIDIWRRELDPGRATLKLSDWRDLFQILANPARRADLAALVIARLRELGQGSTLYGIAAAVGTVLGYRDPTQLEILEISASQLRNAVQFVYPVPGPVAVPALANFTGALTFLTPHLYDAGLVWGSGTWCSLVFDVPAGRRLHIRLTAPDGFQKTWAPVSQTHDSTPIILFGIEMAGHPVHGNWKIEIFREIGSPALNITGWVLYAPGAPRSIGVGPAVAIPMGPPWPTQAPNVIRNAGVGRWKFWWGVYADPTLISGSTQADLREARGTLSRIRHAYQRADVILTKHPIPGTPQVIPGGFIPG